jgi:hypothetical protein
MTEGFAKDLFEDLKNQVPKTRVGFMRHFLPHIEQSLASGHSIRDVWEYARERGFDVSYNDFSKYLRRVRTRNRRAGVGRDNGPQPKAVPISAPGPQAEMREQDPFVNVRRVEAEHQRTTFNYRGTEDLEELVYGTKGKQYKKQ